MTKKNYVRIIFVNTCIIALLLCGYFGLLRNYSEKEEVQDFEEVNLVLDINKEEEKIIPKATLTLVGDFLYEEPYYDALKAGDEIPYYFSKVRKYFEGDDISIGNMEVVIDDGTMKISGSNYSFCAPRSIGHEVASLDLEVLSLANNHANDRGLAGRVSSKKFFKENSSILTVGTYDTEDRDVSGNIIEINGLKFGFLSYTYGTNKAITEDLRYTLGLYKDPDIYKINDEYKELMKKDVEALKGKVDCLIVLMHWGYEYTFIINSEQEELTKFFNELGVDIIVGNHAHNIQPIKWVNTDYHNTLVYYALGNFVGADYTVPGASNYFIKAYQIGLMSRLNVTKTDEGLLIDNITTEPVINFYDKNIRNFLLVPYRDYTEEYETNHYMYNIGFNKDFIDEVYNEVIDKEYQKQIEL